MRREPRFRTGGSSRPVREGEGEEEEGVERDGGAEAEMDGGRGGGAPGRGGEAWRRKVEDHPEGS